MKKYSLLLCFLAAGVLSAQGFSRAGQGYAVTMSGQERAPKTLHFKLNDYRLGNVTINGQTFSTLTCDSRVITEKKGYAELPYFHAAVQVSPHKQYRVVVEKETHEDIVLDHPMLPSRGAIKRNEDPTSLPFKLSDEALRAGRYPAELVTITDPFVCRDIKGQNLYFNAAQYDAATQTLRITTSLTVKLEEVPHWTRDCQSLVTRAGIRPLHEMDKTYQDLFLNYVPACERWPNEVGEVGDILVITTARDQEAIQPYVDHKKAKGFQVEVKVVDKGTEVKSLVKTAYEANPKLLYVQLVGGWQDIKVPIETQEKQPMDPTIGWITDDHYAELIISRFSGNSAQEITDQVNKTLAYEKAPDEEWVKRGIGIASSGGTGKPGKIPIPGPPDIGDDDESDVEHMQAIRDGRLKPAGYTTTDFHGDWVDKEEKIFQKPEPVVDAWNKGVSIVNYVGHGGPGGWNTTKLKSAHIKTLTNGVMLPVVCSVACNTGAYTVKQGCFGEWVVKSPKGGGIAGMFSSTAQDWRAPMRGQDYFMDLLVGGHQYKVGKEKGTDTDHGKSTFGSLATNAAVLMYAESNKQADLETIQTWINFGDGSLKVHAAQMPKPTPAPPADNWEDPKPKAKVGQPGGDIYGVDAAGKPIKLMDYKGKVIVLDISTTWCGMCEKQAPDFNKIHEELQEKGVQCITCLADGATQADCEKWTKTHQAKMPVMTDDKGKKGNARFYLDATGFIPTYVVLDKTFVVRYMRPGRPSEAKKVAMEWLNK